MRVDWEELEHLYKDWDIISDMDDATSFAEHLKQHQSSWLKDTEEVGEELNNTIKSSCIGKTAHKNGCDIECVDNLVKELKDKYVITRR